MTDSFETKFPSLKGKEAQGLRFKFKTFEQEEAILFREQNKHWLKIERDMDWPEESCAVFPAIVVKKCCLDKELVRQAIEEEAARISENAAHSLNVMRVTPEMETWRKAYMESFAKDFPNAIKRRLNL